MFYPTPHYPTSPFSLSLSDPNLSYLIHPNLANLSISSPIKPYLYCILPYLSHPPPPHPTPHLLLSFLPLPALPYFIPPSPYPSSPHPTPLPYNIPPHPPPPPLYYPPSCRKGSAAIDQAHPPPGCFSNALSQTRSNGWRKLASIKPPTNRPSTAPPPPLPSIPTESARRPC